MCVCVLVFFHLLSSDFDSELFVSAPLYQHILNKNKTKKNRMRKKEKSEEAAASNRLLMHRI